MDDDARILGRLRSGDEAAFALLFDLYHASLVRTAMIYVHDAATAEEVAQETWLAVLKGVSRFEGRSSLKTWIFSILINRARTKAQREGRYVALDWENADSDEPAVAADRFWSDDYLRPAQHWVSVPQRWETIPESRLLSLELRARIQHAIDQLSQNQRLVITLRDIDGLSSDEVCNVLGVSETNQRVLLHRARARVRQALETYLGE